MNASCPLGGECNGGLNCAENCRAALARTAECASRSVQRGESSGAGRRAQTQPAVPQYYLGKDGAPAWDVVENWGLNYNTGSAWTYISRAGRKTPDPREDLRKAINMLEREIECFERGMRK